MQAGTGGGGGGLDADPPPPPPPPSLEIDFPVASPSAVPLHAARAESILQLVQLKVLSDPDTDNIDASCTDSGLDSGASDTASTVSWARGSDSFSTDVSDSRLR